MALEVLVVDDEADIRELVAGVLEDEGYAVRAAADSSRRPKTSARSSPWDIWNSFASRPMLRWF